ncbi:cell division protein FtsA [Alkalibacillus almallahensis]|uniref:cell division protein FtsA n=1 Tax=Alkalibacillus almallahensis TaxID=1379154 RepID=UPI00141EF067|nr:cell division protein FtsA [Alkalibacillus almallahensis]NIK11038.1 cell division protein FtsA [Alkalibacillus almallahensis]
MSRLFALDIGTRSVVGIILEKEEDVYHVVDMVSHEHKERSMVDGQIHNVMAVSDVIKTVKEELEAKHGPLTHVCVAAAGRALKTEQSRVSVSIAEQPIMSNEDIFHLELAAVQQAQYQLAEKQADNYSAQYYCVGYSVTHYYLDDQNIGSLIDQQGEEATVDIIATFLPKVVVESLLAALQRADLEMEALTLEPIAAIQVLIPQSMRKLNVALVDVGAGTSDIAITKDGTVFAYGMVPKAGDEITEAISQEYLLDFHQAEQAKRQLIDQNMMEVEDILGFTTSVSVDDVTKQISSSIGNLSRSICEQIISLNKESPQAVMLVGGGSLTPSLTDHIAETLQLPANRVAVRDIEAIKNLKGQEQLPHSPEFVTPIGIAIAAKQSPVHYISVTVNQRMVRLFDVKQLTIGDCLLAAGLEIKKLYGKPGMGLFITFNDKPVTLPGTYGEAPTIKINGEVASLQDHIQHGDEIEVFPGEDGKTPQYTIETLTGPIEHLTVSIHDQPIQVQPTIQLNEENAHITSPLNDGDHVIYQSRHTVYDILEQHTQLDLSKINQSFDININGETVQIFPEQVTVFQNDQKTMLSNLVQHHDRLTYTLNESIQIDDVLTHLDQGPKTGITVFYENKPVELQPTSFNMTTNGVACDRQTLVHPNDIITIDEPVQQSFIFQDLFRFIELNVSEISGKRFKLYRNQEPVGFSEPIQDGDQLSIEWFDSVRELY